MGVFLPGDSTRRSVFSTHTRKRGGIDLWGCCGRRNTSQGGGGQISTVFLRAVSFNFYGRQRSKQQQQHTSNSRTKRTSPDCLMIPCFASDYQQWGMEEKWGGGMYLSPSESYQSCSLSLDGYFFEEIVFCRCASHCEISSIFKLGSLVSSWWFDRGIRKEGGVQSNVPTRLPVTQQLTTKAQLDIGVYLQLLQHASAAAFLFSFLFLLPSLCRFFVLLFSSFPTWILSLTPFSRHPPPPSPYTLPPAPDPPSFTQFPQPSAPFSL